MWIVVNGIGRALLAVMVLLVVSGCRRHLARPVKFSHAVNVVYDISCPETRIDVEAERVFGNDRVYVLDACGTQVELEQGLRVPRSFTSLDPLTNEEIAELRRQLTFPHQALTPVVKQEIAAWCHEGDALVQGESREQCHARLAAALVPLGRGRRPQDSAEHWYAVGQRVFSASTVLTRPPCEHLVLTGTPAACRCRGESECDAAPQRAQAARKGKTARTTPEPTFPMLYARAEIGAGHARVRVGNNARYAGIGVAEAAFIGALLAPEVTLTAGISGFDGLTTQPYSRNQCVDTFICDTETGDADVNHYSLWFRSNVYPFGSGLHLDAGAGYSLGAHFFVVDRWSSGTRSPQRVDLRGGPVLSLGAGYEGLLDNRWYFGLGGRQLWFVGSDLTGSATEGFVTLGMRID